MARRNRNGRNQPAPGWVWMLFGIAIGLVVAAGVYFRTSPPPSATRTDVAPAQAEPPVTREPSAPSGTTRSRPAPPSAAEPAESRFDFYEILPQFEVVVPEVETAAGPATRTRPVEEPGSYVLQAGSFSTAADADRRKASIALLGIESRIQRVTVDDDVYHRVRIGPISNLDSLNRTRKQLRDAGIDTMLMKVPQ
jgi:cell division protein FtsN